MEQRIHNAFYIVTLLACLLGGCAQNDRFYSNTLRVDLFRQLYDEEQLDFLWVLDNSGSMSDRTAYVKNNIGTFLSILSSKKALDYQMAVTDVDYFTQKGALFTGSSGVTVVKSATDADPQGEFADIVNQIHDTSTSFWEQGLESAYQAVNQYGSQFSRPGVNLVIIFVTDADDYSCAGNCYGVEGEHNPGWVPFTVDRYVQYFNQVKAAQGANVQIFPIVGTPASTCQFEDVGTRYMEVMQEVGNGGIAGSVCPNDIAASYQAVAQTIANRARVFPLTSAATSSGGFTVFVDNVLIPNTPDNYIYDPSTNSIVFTGFVPTKGANIEISYQQST